MVVVADAAIAIRGDLSGYNRDLQRAEGTTKGFAGRIQNILSPRNVIGAAGLFGVGLGVHQLVSYAGEAADAYAQLEQTVKTVDQVFGASTGVITTWGETAAETAGMSQREFMSSAAVMGQTLLNMGHDQEEAAEKTVRLLQIAGDLAIAFGKTPQDALLGITAAMRGERDTIEKFGIAIKQVDVNARIAALGLDTSTAAALKNAEAIAVVDLIMEQSADTAGRFAEAEGTVAGKMAEARARWDNFMTQDVGAAVASIQLGALEVGGAVGDFFDRAFNPETSAKVQAFADEFGMTFNEMADHIDQNAKRFGRTWHEQLAAMESNAEKWRTGAVNATSAWAEGITQGMEEGAGEVFLSAEEIAQIPITSIEARYEAIQDAGYQTVLEYAQGLLTPQTEVEAAIQAALQVVEDEMSITEEIAYLSGQRTVLEEARGIASAEGKEASVLAIDAALAVIEDRMGELANKAYDYGFNTATTYADGLNKGYGYVLDAAGNLAAAVRGQIAIESEPPDPRSPLRGITKWGGNIVKTIADGIYGELGLGAGAAGALAGALTPSFAGVSAGMATPMGTTINNYLTVEGVPKQVRNADELWAGFEQMSDRSLVR